MRTPEFWSPVQRRLARRTILRYFLIAGTGLAASPLAACLPKKAQPAGATATPSPTAPQASPSPFQAASPTPLAPTAAATATRVPVPPTATSTTAARATSVPPSPTTARTPTAGPSPLSETVGLVQGKAVDTVVKQAVAAAGGLNGLVKPGRPVVIKVNLTTPSASGGGIVTDSRVVKAVIELCQAAGASKVIVCDGAGGANGDTTAVMKGAGYEAVLADTGATFVDLNRDPVVTVPSPAKLAAAQYAVAKTVAEAETFISVAVLKTHNEAGVTLTTKNLVGITPIASYTDDLARARYRLHNLGIQKVIADLNLLRRIDFAIVDGITGMEGNGPAWGTPVEMDLIVAGRNPLAVDVVGTAVMGFQPGNVEHLVLLGQKGLGPLDLSRIAVRGSTVEAVARKFKPPG